MAMPAKRTKFHVGLVEPAYTAEELEFLKAIDRWQREKGCRFPSWVQVLGLVKSLGYRKVAEVDLRCWEEINLGDGMG